jgi:hypothetical protein
MGNTNSKMARAKPTQSADFSQIRQRSAGTSASMGGK